MAMAHTAQNGRSRARASGSFEVYSWLFMRASAVLLLLLVLAHFGIMHVVAGVERVDYNFVATRFATPFWRSYDLLMLVLALGHGLNGTRIVIEDMVQARAWRVVLLSAMYAVGLILVIVGALVLLTFQPQI
jgi:succinate dehydrogenase / fumarate reductase, membrane anchor subunit